MTTDSKTFEAPENGTLEIMIDGSPHYYNLEEGDEVTFTWEGDE